MDFGVRTALMMDGLSTRWSFDSTIVQSESFFDKAFSTIGSIIIFNAGAQREATRIDENNGNISNMYKVSAVNW